MHYRSLAPFVLMVALAGCSDDPTPPAPGPGGPDTINGNERLGWDQQAANASELATLRYAVYVDGTRSEMSDVTCSSSAGSGGFPCNGRLPAMTPGQHTLELATFVLDAGRVMESARSEPLRVTVSAALAPLDAVVPEIPRTGSAVRRSSVSAAVVAEGFNDITGLSSSPDGRIFVAERSGMVRIISDGALDPRPALLAPDHIVSLALDPNFARSRLIYLLQSARAQDDEPVLRLIRYREAGGALGERAVLLDNLRVRDATIGSVSVGPDAKIYVGLLPADLDRVSANDRTGRVLRLNPDGTTPSDKPGADPVHVANIDAPLGFDWDPRTGALWVAHGTGAAEHLRVRRSAARANDHPDYRMEPGTRMSSIAFYRGELIPSFRGSLLIAAQKGLLRVRLDTRDSTRVASLQALSDQPVRAVTTTADGRVFLATATTVAEIVERPTPKS